MREILVCGGTGCTSSNSKEIIEKIEEIIKRENLENEVKVVRTGCFGLCAKGPVVIVKPENTFYAHVKVSDVEEIINSHIKGNTVVERLLVKEDDNKVVEKLDDLNFYNKQERIVLHNCGKIDPENIDDYIKNDGYKALEKVLNRMTRDEVIEEISKSGLRGRGGAGFPTGKKWSFVKEAEGEEKYVVCNADEGDPGAFMDRSILEGNPHSVLEAMIIAGYAVGASKGYIYAVFRQN